VGGNSAGRHAPTGYSCPDSGTDMAGVPSPLTSRCRVAKRTVSARNASNPATLGRERRPPSHPASGLAPARIALGSLPAASG